MKPPENWKPASPKDAQQLLDDLFLYGVAYTTRRGERIDPASIGRPHG